MNNDYLYWPVFIWIVAGFIFGAIQGIRNYKKEVDEDTW